MQNPISIPKHRRVRPTRVLALAALGTMAAVAAPLVAMPAAGAATITVTATADGGAGSLRAAILEANVNGGANTVVLAANQIYTLTDCQGGALDSSAGPLTIEANGSTIRQTCPNERVLHQGDTTALNVTGATITGGSGVPSGGGILSVGPLTITNSTVTGNSATLGGGGIDAFINTNLTLVNSHIDGNSAPDGGGVSVGGTLTATDSTIDANTGLGAGVVGAVTLLRSHVDKNTKGGIDTSATVSMTNSTVSGNTNGIVAGIFAGFNVTLTESFVLGNTGEAGGILSGGNVSLVRSAVSGNASNLDAGIQGVGVTLEQSTVSSNKANFNGAGIAGTTVRLTNSTVANNSAGGTNAGIEASGPVFLTNATIANNTVAAGTTGLTTTQTLTSFGSVIAPGAGGIACQVATGTTSSGYNFEQGSNTCGFGGGAAGDVANGPDPLLLPLAANGGMTNTMLFQTTSPLKNAIPVANAGCAGLDQRSFTRPQGPGCDIGAVEMRVPVAINGTATTDAGVSVNIDLHPLVSDPDGWLAGATYTVGPQAGSGFAEATGAGFVDYSPNPGFAGSDSFGYQVCDSQKITCVAGTILVTVNGVAAVPLRPIAARPAFAG